MKNFDLEAGQARCGGVHEGRTGRCSVTVNIYYKGHMSFPVLLVLKIIIRINELLKHGLNMDYR